MNFAFVQMYKNREYYDMRNMQMSKKIETYRDLKVFDSSMNVAMVIFEKTKFFPSHEKYSMVDQMRRSSRSVCANLAEAWRRRRYRAAFISKLNEAESEACETQVWLDFAVKCGYLESYERDELTNEYETIIKQIVKMIGTADKWILPVIR